MKVILRIAYLMLFGATAFAAVEPASTLPSRPNLEVVSRKAKPLCQELTLHRELTVYKDPMLFLSNLNVMMQFDPHASLDELLEEGSVLLRRKGKMKVEFLEEQPRELKSAYFQMLAPRAQWMMHEAKQRSGVGKGPILTLPVKLCGGSEDPYAGSVGFIMVSELEYAKTDEKDTSGLPPSVYPNPIPKLVP